MLVFADHDDYRDHFLKQASGFTDTRANPLSNQSVLGDDVPVFMQPARRGR